MIKMVDTDRYIMIIIRLLKDGLETCLILISSATSLVSQLKF